MKTDRTRDNLALLEKNTFFPCERLFKSAELLGKQDGYVKKEAQGR